MPTGFTASINNNEGTTFAQFVWHCSRHFGAMFHLREEKNGVPTLAQAMSEAYSTSYHESELKKAEARLRAILDMSPADMDRQRIAKQQEQAVEWDRLVADKAALKQRYQDMLDQAKAWDPPTDDHVGLRAFMIEQLEESMRWDCYDPEPPKDVDLDTYRAEQVKSSTWDVSYHAEQLAQSRESEAKRRSWVEALHASVPNPRG